MQQTTETRVATRTATIALVIGIVALATAGALGGLALRQQAVTKPVNEAVTKPVTKPAGTVEKSREDLSYCDETYNFYLKDNNDIFLAEKCNKAIYEGDDMRYEVTLEETFYDPENEETVAHILYKEIKPDETVCFEQNFVASTEDLGSPVKVLQVFPGPTDRALLVIPVRSFKDFCEVKLEGGGWTTGCACSVWGGDCNPFGCVDIDCSGTCYTYPIPPGEQAAPL